MKISQLILSVGVVIPLQACYPNFTDIPLVQVQGEERAATYTIAEVISEFTTPTSLFSVTQIISNEDVVIKGIVTSEDNAGNIYKYIIVQEEGDNAQALRISIDAGSLSGIYPLGQRVTVKLNDLWIGNYAQSPQVGVYYANTTKTPVREEPGRIAKVISDQYIMPYGMPVPAAVVPKEMTIAEIRAAGPELYNRLVKIKDATFTGKGSDFGKPATIPASEKIFAPSTGGIGYPQSREITDGTGSLFVSTSEYARFAEKKLPTGTGDIVALVGWYNDRDVTQDPTKIYHQLTIRSLSDLSGGFTFPE